MQLKLLITVIMVALLTSGFTSAIVWRILAQNQPHIMKVSESNEEQDIVKAKEFQVVDETGKKRLVMGLTDGAARVALLDSDGNIGAQLFVSDTDMPALVLGASEDDETGKIVMIVEDKERPALLITDKNGMTKVALKIEIDDLPKFILAGKMNEMSHEPQATMFFKDGTVPKLRFADSRYNILWETPE